MSNPAKMSIYAGPALRGLLQTHGAGEENGGHQTRSGLIEAVAERYIETVSRHTPRLTVNEWCLVWEVLTNHGSQASTSQAVLALPAQVADAVRVKQLDRKWGVDGMALWRKLDTMPWIKRLAVIDGAERFLAADLPDGLSRRDMVVRVVGEAGIADEQDYG